MSTRYLIPLLLCVALAACRAPLPSTPTPSEPSVLKATPSPDAIECPGEVVNRSSGNPPGTPGARTRRVLTSQQLADYLNIMGVDSICIPAAFGPPILNVDWNNLDDPPVAIGRMISIGFEGLDEGAYGWGRGFLVYSTYDFEVGSEYDVFATLEDLEAIRSRSMPRLIRVDGVDGFLRYFPGLSMDTQAVYITYIFPFDTHYLATVLALGLYDPAQVNDIILQMEEGRHPDLANPDLPLFDQLVSSIRFK